MTQSDLSTFSPSEADDEAAESDAAEAAAVVAGNGGGRISEVVDIDEAKVPDSNGTVELMVTQIDYTIEGYGREEHPVIHVFGRREDGTEEHVQVLGFEPYFYVPTDSLEGPPEEEYDVLIDSREVDADGEEFESIRGEKLTKIIGRTPRDVGQVRDEFDHYEADILFPNRFLIDKGINSGIRVSERRLDNGTIQVPHTEVVPTGVDTDLRVNIFDIEVDDRRGFPEDGEEPIVCLTSYDSFDDEYIAWLYEAPDGDGQIPDELPDYDPYRDGLSVDVRSYDSEAAMLEEFISYIEATDPDILTGWNFEDFDAPYFLDRLEVLNERDEVDEDLSIDRLSRVNEVWRSGWGGPNIKGRVVFDLLYGYKRTQFTELDSYRLDAVGETELDIGKERYSGDIGDLWENDPTRLLEYNLRDVELCMEIDAKQGLIDFWDEVRKFVGCKLEDAPTPGDAVDQYVLHKAYGKFALPTKGKQDAEEFEGGAVFDPITGVKENITVLDLKSLYPMCMVTINAGPETKVGDDFEGETYQAPNGSQFRKQPDGIMREMVDELLTERENKKELRNQHEPDSSEYAIYDTQQAAVKVIMNCFTPDTEVMTPEGVRDITDLTVGDEVYSLDPETLELEIKPVIETHAYPDYRGELVDIQTTKTDFRVTPNHRMLVRKNDRNGITEDEYSFVEAGDLHEYCNYELPHDWTYDGGKRIDRIDLTELVDDYEVWVQPSISGPVFKDEFDFEPRRSLKANIGETGYVFSAEEFEAHRDYIESVCERSYVHAESNRKWIPRTYDGDDFLGFLAWYITEGNTYTSTPKQFGENYRGSATTVKVAQNLVADGGTAAAGGGGGHHANIGDLLDRMGLDYYSDDRSYQFTSRLFGNLLEELCGEDSFTKRIPELIFEASREQKERFLSVLIDGDGDRQPGSWRYTTSSQQLRDDVLRLCTHLGITASYNRDSGSWRIYVTEDAKNSVRMHRSGSRSTAEDGVYCVTVEDNHTLLAGRNGKFQFVGQSLYGVTGWDRFRLYDKEGAAAVTATGREVINFTETAANELDYDVAYGDTDSVMLELDSGVNKSDAIDQSFEIEEYINSRYDDFAREELGADVHRFQIEFEKLYRRFFQAGTKKRYAGHIIWKEGKDVDDIDITGFEYKRSDIAPITKQVQKDVIEMIVTGDDLDSDLEEIKTYLTTVIEEFRNGERSVDEIGIPGGIGKRLDAYETPTAQVRGAKYANLMLGTNFDRGSKPKRLYLETIHPSFFRRMEDEEGLDPQRDPLYGEFKRDPDVICFEYADQVPEEFEVDTEKMLEKTLKGPISRVIEALDMSWEEIKTGQTQTGLEQYW